MANLKKMLIMSVVVTLMFTLLAGGGLAAELNAQEVNVENVSNLLDRELTEAEVELLESLGGSIILSSGTYPFASVTSFIYDTKSGLVAAANSFTNGIVELLTLQVRLQMKDNGVWVNTPYTTYEQKTYAQTLNTSVTGAVPFGERYRTRSVHSAFVNGMWYTEITYSQETVYH